MDIRIIFGRVLCRVRKQKGMSQEKLALNSDTDRSYISKLERGGYQPTLAMIFSLAKELGIRPGELVDMVEMEIEEAGK